MSDGITEARSYRREMNSITPGSVYKHFKGGMYAVIAVTWDTNDVHSREARKVSYISLEDGRVYSRDLKEFVTPKIHEESGMEEQRFMRIGFANISIDTQGIYRVTLEL